MKQKNEILYQAANASQKGLPVLLRKAAINYENVQEETLLDILACAQNSEFGKKYRFDKMKSADDFRKNVPITEFNDYRNYIERMKKGEENVLYDGKTLSFVMTSGTTGGEKYIPESPRGELVKKIVSNMRTLEMIRCCPEAMLPDKKILAITNLAVYNKTEGGIPVGSASGQAAGADAAAAEKLVLPPVLLTAAELELETVDYLSVLFSIANRNVIALICNNVAHFEMLLKLLNSRFDSFVSDIRSGTISVEISDKLRAELMKSWKADARRAEELEKIYQQKGSLTTEDIWTGFKFVSCWLSSDVGRIAKELRGLFPKNTMFFDWGYGASEGKFNVPVQPDQSDGLVAGFGYFFEFLPIGGKDPILLKDTIDGEMYELIFTTYSGLYRYNIHDIVKISDNNDGSKSMEFVCKASDKLVLGGKELYSVYLTDIVESYEKANNTTIRLFQGENLNESLQLYIEPVDKNIDKTGFEAYMKAELNKIGILLAGVEWKESGYRNALFNKRVSAGKTINQTKLRIFI